MFYRCIVYIIIYIYINIYNIYIYVTGAGRNQILCTLSGFEKWSQKVEHAQKGSCKACVNFRLLSLILDSSLTFTDCIGDS